MIHPPNPLRLLRKQHLSRRCGAPTPLPRLRWIMGRGRGCLFPVASEESDESPLPLRYPNPNGRIRNIMWISWGSIVAGYVLVLG